MGTRVEFYFGTEDSLETTLLKNLRAFREWLARAIKDEPDSYGPLALAQADSVLEKGRTALKAKDDTTALYVDKLVEAFVGDFCDHGDGQNLLEIIPLSIVNVSHYYECYKYLEKDTFLEAFWNFILNGRPLARNPNLFPYNSSDGVFYVSFATAEEVQTLHSAITKISVPGQNDNSSFFNDASLALKIAHEAVDAAYYRGVGLIITVA